MATVRLFKVGADPEFSFINNGGDVVSADRVLTRVRSKFGLDGCEAIAEMRPSPSINPSQVVSNLYRDLLEGYHANPESRGLYWKAGSIAADEGDVYATGGHIHFGIHSAVTRRIYGDRGTYYSKLSSYLDVYLAQVVRLLEDPKELRGRLRNEYGFLGDHRANTHGLEYRVLGSWLTSPRVAEGVLCLAQAAVYQHMWSTINYGRDFPLSPLAPPPGPDNHQDEEDEESEDGDDVTGDLKKYRTKFPALRSDIRKFKLYKRYELPIEFLFRLIEKRKTWYPGKGVDMKQAWGIASVPFIPRRTPGKNLPSVRYEDIWKRARS